MNSNYVEKEDGWHKVDESKSNGNAGYFKKTPPPMRDKAGRPMKNYDEIDVARWIKEVNEQNAK